MQEDKETTFDAIRAFGVVVAAMTGMIADLEPVPEAMHAAASRGYSTATDLADWLVRNLKLPFREAHHVTGNIVRLAEKDGIGLEALSLEAMQKAEPRKINRLVRGEDDAVVHLCANSATIDTIAGAVFSNSDLRSPMIARSTCSPS